MRGLGGGQRTAGPGLGGQVGGVGAVPLAFWVGLSLTRFSTPGWEKEGGDQGAPVWKPKGQEPLLL